MKQVTPKRVRRKLLLHRQPLRTIRKTSAAHVSLSSICTCQRTEARKLQNNPPKTRDNKAAPKSVFVIQPCQVMETTKGAGQTPAPPSLLDVYSHHQLQPSSDFPKKNPNSKKSLQSKTQNWGKHSPQTQKNKTKSTRKQSTDTKTQNQNHTNQGSRGRPKRRIPASGRNPSVMKACQSFAPCPLPTGASRTCTTASRISPEDPCSSPGQSARRIPQGILRDG
jgi:hypothetical protein